MGISPYKNTTSCLQLRRLKGPWKTVMGRRQSEGRIRRKGPKEKTKEQHYLGKNSPGTWRGCPKTNSTGEASKSSSGDECSQASPEATDHPSHWRHRREGQDHFPAPQPPGVWDLLADLRTSMSGSPAWSAAIVAKSTQRSFEHTDTCDRLGLPCHMPSIRGELRRPLLTSRPRLRHRGHGEGQCLWLT